MTKFAIVGNAPSDMVYADDIDASDIVVRFNNAHGYGQQNGSKIDDLYLVNCGGQPVEWLQSATFWREPHVVAAPLVTLPIASNPKVVRSAFELSSASETMDGLNMEIEMRSRLSNMGKTVQTLPRQAYLRACKVVAGTGKSLSLNEPSTGFLAIYHYLQTARSIDIVSLFGFGFAGWQGHAWQRERAWVKHQQSIGRLVLYPTY